MIMSNWTGALSALLLLVCAPWAAAQSPSDLKPGHWIEAKGSLVDGVFVVSEFEVAEPEDDEELIGTASRASSLDMRFEVLGMRVDVAAETSWQDIAFDAVEGRRVKVQGRWKGGKFAADEVASRGEGRDRITGRVDAVHGTAPDLRLEVMDFDLRLTKDTKVSKPGMLLEAKLAPERKAQRRTEVGRVEADDFIPGSLKIGDTLSFGALLDTKWTRQANRDLDEALGDDIDSPRAALRLQLLWLPTASTSALVSPRVEYSNYIDENGPDDERTTFKLNEVWLRQDDLLGSGAWVQAGRLDFDDDREWIWKRYLDGARLRWERGGWNAEVGAMTLVDGDDSSSSDLRDEDTSSMYASFGWSDKDKSWTAWLLDQRFTGVDPSPRGGDADLDGRDWPFYFGVRVIGEWFKDFEGWLDLALVRGYRGDVDIEGSAIDIGATWEGSAIAPFYATAAWSWASGDDPSTPDVNEAFRQTGWQRNNGKFGGVTSFRYYGEAVDPELSNLGIFTLGVGARLGRKNSIDLVWHAYSQDRAANYIRDSSIDIDPDGVSTDLGTGMDLVFGSKAFDGWDFELVYSRFFPGDAFSGADALWLASAQVRYRF